MANSASALKRIRQAATRTARNKTLTSRLKTFRKKALEAAAAGDQETAKKAYSEFTSVVDKCANKNIIHKSKAANLKSKTNKRIATAS